MKKLLLLFTLLISHFSFAQLNVYNDVLIDEIPNELLEYNDTKIYFDNQKSRLHFTKENDYTANSILAETQIILTVGFSKVDPNLSKGVIEMFLKNKKDKKTIVKEKVLIDGYDSCYEQTLSKKKNKYVITATYMIFANETLIIPNLYYEADSEVEATQYIKNMITSWRDYMEHKVSVM